MDALQNDSSKNQCVFNFAYSQDIGRQFKFKVHSKFFAEKRKESAYFSDDFKFVKGFNFLSTFMIISFILNVKFKSWVTVLQHP